MLIPRHNYYNYLNLVLGFHFLASLGFSNRRMACKLGTVHTRHPFWFLQASLRYWVDYSTASKTEISVDNTPRRAVMYCPGDDIKKINKGLASKADCIVLDCEDGVATNRKEAARNLIKSVFDSSSVPVRPEVAVRVNSVSSGLCDEDLATVLSGTHTPQTLFLPKVESIDNLQWFAERLDQHLRKSKTVKLVMYAESARAILDLPEICRAAVQLSQTHAFVPVGLALGSDDLCASLGAARSVDGAEISYARQRLVLVAKAFSLQAIDMVHIQFKELDSLREQSIAGARLGYTGKQVIHPNQIETVQRAFMPSPEQVQWAREVIQGFHLSQQEGKGAFVHAGSMVDMPLLRQAENILRISETEEEV